MPAPFDPAEGPRPEELSAPEKEKLALYGALCLFLSTIEFLIPKPIPFFRLGLANLPVLWVLRKESFRFVLALVGLKVLGQALVNGTLFSYIFVFSTVGSVASGIVMALLSLLPPAYVSLVGISVFGALASNLAQVFLARYLLLGEGAWLIAPPFLAIGTVTGTLLGGIALALREGAPERVSLQGTSPGTPWFPPTGRPATDPGSPDPNLSTLGHVPPKSGALASLRHGFQGIVNRHVSPGLLFLIGLLSLPPFLFQDSLGGKLLLGGTYLLCAALSGLRIKPLYYLMAILFVTLANLITPLGQVLLYIGRFPLTEGALRLGLSKSFTLVGMIALTRFTARSTVPLPGQWGAVFSRMFFYFERLTAKKFRIRPSRAWEDIATLLNSLVKEEYSGSPEKTNAAVTTFKGYLFCLGFLSVSWVVPILFR